MIIHAISDMHGYRPNLPGGGLLLIAGDCTNKNSDHSWGSFFVWLKQQEYDKKILVAGNHDRYLYERGLEEDEDIVYLQNSGYEYRGLKIWGSPWGVFSNKIKLEFSFFTETENSLEQYFSKIPEDTDILITHTPPFNILSETDEGEDIGSHALYNRVQEIKPALHVFGHNHNNGGLHVSIDGTTFVNASIMDEQYSPRMEYMEIIPQQVRRKPIDG